MKIKYEYILLGLLVTLPIVAGMFKQIGLEVLSSGFMVSFGVTIWISLIHYLDGGFSK